MELKQRDSNLELLAIRSHPTVLIGMIPQPQTATGLLGLTPYTSAGSTSASRTVHRCSYRIPPGEGRVDGLGEWPERVLGRDEDVATRRRLELIGSP